MIIMNKYKTKLLFKNKLKLIKVQMFNQKNKTKNKTSQIFLNLLMLKKNKRNNQNITTILINKVILNDF